MGENFFAQVNVPAAHVHIPDGAVPRERLAEHCAAYERDIVAAGGIDFQLLGVGKSGHVGFNEPGSAADSRTRLVRLDAITRKDAAGGFFCPENLARAGIPLRAATLPAAQEIAPRATGATTHPI